MFESVPKLFEIGKTKLDECYYLEAIKWLERCYKKAVKTRDKYNGYIYESANLIYISYVKHIEFGLYMCNEYVIRNDYDMAGYELDSLAESLMVAEYWCNHFDKSIYPKLLGKYETVRQDYLQKKRAYDSNRQKQVCVNEEDDSIQDEDFDDTSDTEVLDEEEKALTAARIKEVESALDYAERMADKNLYIARRGYSDAYNLAIEYGLDEQKQMVRDSAVVFFYNVAVDYFNSAEENRFSGYNEIASQYYREAEYWAGCGMEYEGDDGDCAKLRWEILDGSRTNEDEWE